MTAAMFYIISTIRSIVFYCYDKKKLKPSLLILLLFETVSIISGILSWQNIWSIIPIIVTIVFTYGLWQDNIKITRITCAFAGYFGTFYNILVGAYIGALPDLVLGVSSTLSLIRNKILNKKNDS